MDWRCLGHACCRQAICLCAAVVRVGVHTLATTAACAKCSSSFFPAATNSALYSEYETACRSTKDTFVGFGITCLVLGVIMIVISYLLKVKVDKVAAARAAAGPDNMGTTMV